MPLPVTLERIFYHNEEIEGISLVCGGVNVMQISDLQY